MREIKNVIKSVYNIVDKMEDRTGELEDKSFEITQSKEKKVKKSEEVLCNLQDSNKYQKNCSQKNKSRRKGRKFKK